MSDETVNGIADNVDDLVSPKAPESNPVADAIKAAQDASIAAALAKPEPIEAVEDVPHNGVPRDLSMGPSGGAAVKAFLEAKQAEADAKARADA